MAEETEAVARPKGTVFFERKVQVRDYEAATAGIHVGFDFDPEAGVESPDSFAQRAPAAFFEAKAVVFDELGIDFDIIDGKVVEKLVTKAFGNVTEATGTSTGGNTNAAPPADGISVPSECEKCGGPLWDNRAKKRSGQFSAKSPDFACRDKSCGAAIWLKK